MSARCVVWFYFRMDLVFTESAGMVYGYTSGAWAYQYRQSTGSVVYAAVSFCVFKLDVNVQRRGALNSNASRDWFDRVFGLALEICRMERLRDRECLVPQNVCQQRARRDILLQSGTGTLWDGIYPSICKTYDDRGSQFPVLSKVRTARRLRD